MRNVETLSGQYRNNYTRKGGALTVRFKADSSVEGKGFRAIYLTAGKFKNVKYASEFMVLTTN